VVSLTSITVPVSVPTASLFQPARWAQRCISTSAVSAVTCDDFGNLCWRKVNATLIVNPLTVLSILCHPSSSSARIHYGEQGNNERSGPWDAVVNLASNNPGVTVPLP